MPRKQYWTCPPQESQLVQAEAPASRQHRGSRRSSMMGTSGRNNWTQAIYTGASHTCMERDVGKLYNERNPSVGMFTVINLKRDAENTILGKYIEQNPTSYLLSLQ